MAQDDQLQRQSTTERETTATHPGGAVGMKFQLRLGRPSSLALRNFFMLVVSVAVLVGLIVWNDRANASTFNSMTSTEHLRAANEAELRRDYGEGLRHLGAIPDAVPDAIAAREATARLLSEQAAAAAELDARRAAETQRRQQAPISATQLQASLKEAGYDVTVSPSDDPTVVTIASTDFKDTENRVRFLARLRGQRWESGGICLMGFEQVHLLGGGIFGRIEFSESYATDCGR
jgi:hypothetical protein